MFLCDGGLVSYMILSWKWMLGAMLALTLLVGLLLGSHYYYLERSNREALSQRAGSTVQLLSVSAHHAVLSEDINTLRDLARQVLKQPDVIYFTIQDADGHFLLFQGRDGVSKENYKKRSDLAHSVSIIKESGYIFAIVELGLSRAQMQQVIGQAMRWSWSAGGVLWLLGCLAIFFGGWRLGRGELRYHDLFANHTAIKLLVDPENDYRIIDANCAAEQFYGYSKEQLCDLKVSQINVLSEPEIMHEMASASREGRDYFFFRHQLASGEEREVEVHSGPVSLDGHTILYQIVHDITDRRRSEQALERGRTELEQANRRLHTVLDGLEATVFVADSRTQRVLYINRTMWELVGDVVGRKIAHLFDPQADEKHKVLWESAHLWPKVGARIAREYLHPLNNKWYLSHIHGVEWSDGRPVRLEVATNISRFKESERATHQAMELADDSTRAKGVLLDAVSHAFTPPLQKVTQVLTYLKSEESSAGEGRWVSELERVVEQLNTRIQDLQVLGQLDAQSRTSMERTPFRFRSLLDRLRNQYPLGVTVGGGFRIQLELDDAAADQRFLGDPGRHHQLFSAMLRSYGLGARCEGVVIRLDVIATEGEDSNLILECFPKQVGGAMRTQHRYRPFSPLQSSQGDGELALILMARLAQWMGIMLEISTVGAAQPALRLHMKLPVSMGDHGATKRPTLYQRPAWDPPAQDDAEPRPSRVPEIKDIRGSKGYDAPTVQIVEDGQAEPTHGPTPPLQAGRYTLSEGGDMHQHSLNLLVVEDDPVSQMVIRAILEDRGHQVTMTESGEQGLALAMDGGWNMLLVDRILPGMGGLEMIEQLRQAEQQQGAMAVPIVMMSAEVTRETVDACREAGGDEILVKPIVSERLTTIMRRLVPEMTQDDAPEDPAQGETESPSLNRAHLDILAAEMTRKEFQNLSERFEKNAINYLVSASTALEQSDRIGVHTALHTLAGSAASFGLQQLADTIRHASHESKKAEPAWLKQVIGEGHDELNVGMRHLKTYMNQAFPDTQTKS
ncbi:response regulator [Magnetococcus sp. PR-3]|uniref:response regulator n=1 Tax=Magnetococcus sp. PR-3 TaxID=3120355 RepID=UPI002FCE5E13